MRHGRLLRVSAFAGITALALTACGESAVTSSDGSEELEPDTLVISGVPAEEGTDLSNTYTPVVEMLEDELDMEVEFEPSTSYASVIEGQRNGQIHVAQYGPLGYYQAEQSGSEVEVLGAMIQEEGEDPGYTAYGVVPEGSDIDDISDFEDKELCFVDESSTSGYLYPVHGLMEEAGLEEGDWEENPTGGHDASAIAVANGECDAGFALDSMIDETLPEKGDIEEGDLDVVWESEMIAEPPITVFGGLESDLKAQLHEIFAEQGNQNYLVENDYCEEGDCDLTDQRIWGWGEVDDDYYDSLVEVCDVTQIQACTEGS